MSDSPDQIEPLLHTPLHALHLELGARMVPFAGYAMPVQYPAGIMEEHRHTRDRASLFDVSHMGQVMLSGVEAAQALESLVPVDVIDLPTNRQRYALFTNAQGGILDDLMVTNAGDYLYLVVNATCKAQDLAHLRKHIARQCDINELKDRALLALQGPAAAQVLGRLAPVVTEVSFMSAVTTRIGDAACFVTRSGYTGEDGFEISVPSEHAETLARTLLAQAEVAPAGLGARDSLRLEAGLCLYGHDIDAHTTPVEANLRWAISKSRRRDGERAGGFPGEQTILTQMEQGVARKRVGILPEGRAPVREGTELVDEQNQALGTVTSGGFGPTVGGPVAMGYVRSDHAQVDTQLFALVRGKPRSAKVVRLPFVEQRYYRG